MRHFVRQTPWFAYSFSVETLLDRGADDRGQSIREVERRIALSLEHAFSSLCNR
jgi:hypothetical protein